MLGARLYFIQIEKTAEYRAKAQSNQTVAKQSLFRRGEIFMQDQQEELTPLAINKQWFNIYAVPAEIKPDRLDSLARQAAELLDLDPDLVRNRLAKAGDPYEPLKQRLEEKEAKAVVKQLNSPGIRISADWGRFYPLDELSAHTVGFVGFQSARRVGQYGLEEYWDKDLQGAFSPLPSNFDALGNLVSWTKQGLTGAQSGSDLVLSLDPNISARAGDILKDLVQSRQARGGQIAIMDPQTGFLKALVAYPSFNPNQYWQYEAEKFLSPFYQLTFEPGSVFKPFTFAAALDTASINPQDTFQDPGQVRIGPETVRNFDGRSHGTVTMTEVLELSLNTGAIYVLEQTGEESFKNYLKKFGFGEKTGLRLKGETGGDISNLDSGRPINFATASFGQGISVTPIQLIRAFSAIANGGYLYRPQLVEKIVRPDGQITEFKPQLLEKVISSETASRLTAMLVSVVENGFGRKAQVPGYWVAGKTGTAQIADPEKGGYLPDEVVHTFIGYAPAYDPAFITLIKLDGPKGIRFASDSVAPAFAELAKFILNYYQIPPSRSQ